MWPVRWCGTKTGPFLNQRKHTVPIFRCIILFWVTNRVSLSALLLKKCQFSSCAVLCSSIILTFWNSFWNQSTSLRPWVLASVSLNVWHGDIVWCQEVTEIKGGTTDEAFQELQEQHVQWDRGAPIGLILIYVWFIWLESHKKNDCDHWKKKKKKSYWEPVFVVLWSVSCTPATDYIWLHLQSRWGFHYLYSNH